MLKCIRLDKDLSATDKAAFAIDKRTTGRPDDRRADGGSKHFERVTRRMRNIFIKYIYSNSKYAKGNCDET